MQCQGFTDAMEICKSARMMKECLPDGQYEEITEVMEDFGITFKTKESELDADAVGEFVSEINRNLIWWL